MTSKVIMSLGEYDRLQCTINKQNKKIEQMARDRVAEMKRIFQLQKTYSGADIFIDATDVIAEIYGEETTIRNTSYKLRNADLTSSVYGAYLEVKEAE